MADKHILAGFRMDVGFQPVWPYLPHRGREVDRPYVAETEHLIAVHQLATFVMQARSIDNQGSEFDCSGYPDLHGKRNRNGLARTRHEH